MLPGLSVGLKSALSSKQCGVGECAGLRKLSKAKIKFLTLH